MSRTSGARVDVLAAYPPTPTPVYLLHPSARQPSPRLRRFTDRVVDEVGQQIRAALAAA